MWEYRAALPDGDAAIHDGDTVKLLIDLGFDVRTEKWIRLADVRAPELNQPGGIETRAFTVGWLRSRTGPQRGLRWPLRVITDMTRAAEPSQVTSFARYVGEIYDVSGGGALNNAVSLFLSGHPEWPPGKLPPGHLG